MVRAGIAALALTIALQAGHARAVSITEADFEYIFDSFQGSEVDADNVMPGPGPEAEYPGANDSLNSIDLTPGGLVTIDFDLGTATQVGAPVRWEITNIEFDMDTEITGVTQLTGDPALLSSVSFAPDAITIGLVNFEVPPNDPTQSWSFQADFQTVPLPAALPLLLAGLGGLALVGRRTG